MVSTRQERGATLRGAQVIAFLYSFVFLFAIAFGYYLLFQQSILLALGAAILFSLLAWWLAKFVGSNGGIRRQPALFAMLLIISAVGVFNSLMLNAEGQRIFVEAIDRSRQQFDQLEGRAMTELSRGGGDSPLAHMRRVENLKAALFSEIRNPLNCGQGPEARKIFANLREELPEFRALSARKLDCSQNAKIIEDYDRRIDDLVARAAWSNQALMSVVTDSTVAKQQLDRLSEVADTSLAPTLLGEVSPQLQQKGSLYRELLDRLPAGQARAGLLPRLDLRSVESLGKISQLINLLVDRLDKPTTYVYLLLAFAVDWMMVHLFMLVAQNRGRRIDPDLLDSSIRRAF